MAPKKNVTFDDIAKYTHFSKTTISRYFNNPDSLTLENQQIISDALVKLNYKENKVAKILANGNTEFIGIIIPNLYLNYYSEMLNQILSTYETFGYKFLVFVGNESEEAERKYIQELLAYKIEGLIVLSHTIPSKELADLQIPLVSIERENQYISSINTDNYMGAIQATSLLAKHDCDVLIHVNSPTPESIPAYRRIQGFLDICEQKGLEHRIYIRDLGNQYRRYGTLPEDYLLVGFDNSPISREAIIPISTVGQQIDKIAFEAVKLLDGQIKERKKRKPAPIGEPVHKVITPILCRRETTEGFSSFK